MSTRTPRSIAQILEQVGNSDLRTLSVRSRLAADLERQVLACLPAELAGQCRVGGVSEGCLRLLAPTPAWAARLRFEAPRLVKSLLQQGATAIRSVDVRIAPPATPRVAPERHIRMSPDNARLLEQTARAISDPRLAQALARLARRGRQERS
jgi:hypothetical protein